MKIQLLIAISDEDYTEHLSSYLTERYSETFDVFTSRDVSGLSLKNSTKQYDVALVNSEMMQASENIRVRLKFLLTSDRTVAEQAGNIKAIRQYQRISAIVSQILEEYAAIQGSSSSDKAGNGRMVAVWSPCGGSGKTTVAVSWASRLAAAGRRTLYLDLELFSSVDVYFEGSGKGISTVLEKLDKDVDIGLVLTSARHEDSGSGVSYYCKPDNYDDMNVLSVEDINKLLSACLQNMDDVVVDLPSSCDERVRRVMEYANQIVVVVDNSKTSEAKWNQFVTQNDVYSLMRSKMTIVANRGAKVEASQAERIINLPTVHSVDPVAVYKTLSTGYLAREI